MNRLNTRKLDREEINQLIFEKFHSLHSAITEIDRNLFDLSVNDRILVDAYLRINAAKIKPTK